MGNYNEDATTYSSDEVVTLNYADLLNKRSDLSDTLEKGFGPHGLGIVAISNVPGYPELRQKLLPLAEKLAHLPRESLKKLEDPESSYSYGWSHGAEKFHGKIDDGKGSFLCKYLRGHVKHNYHKVMVLAGNGYNRQCLRAVLRYKHGIRLRVGAIFGLGRIYQSLNLEIGALIKEVGCLLAHHCDKYQYKKFGQEGEVETILCRSQGHKGRLLYYYPIARELVHNDVHKPEWCGWHTDFGALTGLTAAMYTKGGLEVPCPDAEAGLYIRTSSGRVVRATFDATNLAYQVGETAELLSGGLLHATPHCVQTPKPGNIGVARSTLAVFLQPSREEILRIPESTIQKVNPVIPHTTNLTFGEYSDLCTEAYATDSKS